MARCALRTPNARLPFEVLDHHFLQPIVEQISDRQPAPHSRKLDCRAGLIADLPECAVARIQKQQARLTEANSNLCIIDLWIDMAVHRNQVQPSVVIEVIEGISPADQM